MEAAPPSLSVLDSAKIGAAESASLGSEKLELLSQQFELKEQASESRMSKFRAKKVKAGKADKKEKDKDKAKDDSLKSEKKKKTKSRTDALSSQSDQRLQLADDADAGGGSASAAMESDDAVGKKSSSFFSSVFKLFSWKSAAALPSASAPSPMASGGASAAAAPTSTAMSSASAAAPAIRRSESAVVQSVSERVDDQLTLAQSSLIPRRQAMARDEADGIPIAGEASWDASSDDEHDDLQEEKKRVSAPASPPRPQAAAADAEYVSAADMYTPGFSTSISLTDSASLAIIPPRQKADVAAGYAASLAEYGASTTALASSSTSTSTSTSTSSTTANAYMTALAPEQEQQQQLASSSKELIGSYYPAAEESATPTTSATPTPAVLDPFGGGYSTSAPPRRGYVTSPPPEDEGYSIDEGGEDQDLEATYMVDNLYMVDGDDEKKATHRRHHESYASHHDRIHVPQQVEPPPQPAYDPEEFAWNERFQRAVAAMQQAPLSAPKEQRLHVYTELAALAQDFAFTAETYGRIIISEVGMPPEKKTIKPLQLGGVVGGDKYICHGVLFKVHTSLRNVPSDHHAMLTTHLVPSTCSLLSIHRASCVAMRRP